MIRFEHRVKTHGRWRVRQPESGVWIWRSPNRAYYLVTNAGTYSLGDGPFATPGLARVSTDRAATCPGCVIRIGSAQI